MMSTEIRRSQGLKFNVSNVLRGQMSDVSVLDAMVCVPGACSRLVLGLFPDLG